MNKYDVIRRLRYLSIRAQRVASKVPYLNRLKPDGLAADVSAGVTVGIMIVPQSMAYAMLAGLPPVIGLYAACVPPLAYAILGSSRFLGVGPVAIDSLLVSKALHGKGIPDIVTFAAAAAALCILVGILQMLLGFLRLGVITNFISHSVITGFTSAAAIIIFLSQLPHLLGIKLAGETDVARLLVQLSERVWGLHWPTLLIAVASVGILILVRTRATRIPGPLFVVALGTLLVWLLRLDHYGVAIVQTVPQGLPHFSMPSLEAIEFDMSSDVLLITFIASMEALSVARILASREREKVDSNRELIALGTANVASGLFGGFQVTGSFSRSAVMYQARSRSRLAGVFVSIVVLLTLLLLTPLFYYLPNAVLASIVVVAVVSLIDYRGMRYLFRVRTADGLAFLATFFGVLFLGIGAGVVAGVAVSLALFIWRTIRPRVVELGFSTEQGIFRNREGYHSAHTFPGVLVLRVDMPLYFANVHFVEDRVREDIAREKDIKWVIFECSGVADVDVEALRMLYDLARNTADQGVGFAFAAMKTNFRDAVHRAGWEEGPLFRMGFPSVSHALEALGVAVPGWQPGLYSCQLDECPPDDVEDANRA